MKTSNVELCEQIVQLCDKLRMSYAMVAERNNLTKAQLFTLYTIATTDEEMLMSKVAQHLHCDASNLTGIVDRLIAHDLVISTTGKHDRRAKTLTPTEKGKRLIIDLQQSLPDYLGCNKLDDQERINMSAALYKMQAE